MKTPVILIVEDNEHLRLLAEGALQGAKYTTRWTDNINVARRKLLDGEDFLVEDIEDLASLVSKVKSPQPSDLFSQFIKEQLSSLTINLLAEYQGGYHPQLQQALVRDMNELAHRGNVFSSQIISSLVLTKKTKWLFNQNPMGNALVRLNQRLIEDAYPSEIKHDIGLLVLDINELPENAGGEPKEEQGIKLLKELRALPEYKLSKFPIICTTVWLSKSPPTWQDRALAAGANGFYEVPLARYRLVEICSELINKYYN